MADEANTKESLSVECPQYEYRAVVEFACAINFISYVYANSTPPYFALVVERRFRTFLYFLFTFVPTVKVSLHSRYCSITKPTLENT